MDNKRLKGQYKKLEREVISQLFIYNKENPTVILNRLVANNRPINVSTDNGFIKYPKETLASIDASLFEPELIDGKEYILSYVGEECEIIEGFTSYEKITIGQGRIIPAIPEEEIKELFESRDWDQVISYDDFKIAIRNEETFEECINRIRNK